MLKHVPSAAQEPGKSKFIRICKMCNSALGYKASHCDLYISFPSFMQHNVISAASSSPRPQFNRTLKAGAKVLLLLKKGKAA